MIGYIENITLILKSLIENLFTKVLLGVGVSVYSFLFSFELWQITLAVGILIFFDLITGVAVAKKKKEVIESRKILRTAFKLSVYCVLISSSHLTDVAMRIPLTFLSLESAMIGFLAATELISIIENAGRMGYAVPQRILNQLSNFKEKGNGSGRD